MKKMLLGLAVLLMLPACALMPYESRFKCPEPQSGTCASVSEVYEAADSKKEEVSTAPKTAGPICLGVPSAEPGSPLRLPPRIVRLRVLPYTDSEGDLHQGGYVYLEVDKGRWLFERRDFKERQERILPVFKDASMPEASDAKSIAAPDASDSAPDCPTCGKEE